MPSGLRRRVTSGTTVLEAARTLGVDLDSVCGGRGICGRCQVEPVFGSFAKLAINARQEHLSPPGSVEVEYKGKRALGDAARLGCSTKILGDVVLDVPTESQIHKQVIHKSVDVGDLVLDPVYTLHYIGETEVTSALRDRWDLEVTSDKVIPSGPVTVAVRDHSTVTSVWPGYVDRIAGIAFDVGSTTIAGHLVDLGSGEVLATAGRMNPQIRFGEDLMSRVSYVMMNPGGDAELTTAVRGALAELSVDLLAESEVNAAHVLDVIVVGNPIMHHLVLGHDPTPLGQAPFPLAVEGSVETSAVSLGLALPNASVYVPPCIAGHVGADTAAAIINEGPHRSPATQLLVDVGTNAEIVLGNSERLLAASSPTGPALEGAQISSGQRATAGAIERVRVDRESLEPRFKVIGSELWSNDADFAATLGGTGVTGICGSGIIEAISELVLSGVIDASGAIIRDHDRPDNRVVPQGRTLSYMLHADIFITQADVRAVQLAKAALRAGIELLLEHGSVSSIDEVRLAGAFGSRIDPAHAMVVGLIPDVALDSVRSVGNSAGSGAVRLLLSAAQRREVEAVVATVTKIETATEPRFQELFVAALAFPRSTAPVLTKRSRRRRNHAT